MNQNEKTINEKLKASPTWHINRWASEEDYKNKRIYSEEEALKLFGAHQFTEIKKNILLNIGINELWTLVCSAGGTRYDAANAQLGVGDSTVATAATQTALQAAVNVFWKGMMAAHPTFGTAQQAVWRSQFLGGEANFAWNEFAIRNGATANRLLNRLVSAQGTKVAGHVWELSLTITLS